MTSSTNRLTWLRLCYQRIGPSPHLMAVSKVDYLGGLSFQLSRGPYHFLTESLRLSRGISLITHDRPCSIGT
jgi:hypothetical protein